MKLQKQITKLFLPSLSVLVSSIKFCSWVISYQIYIILFGALAHLLNPWHLGQSVTGTSAVAILIFPMILSHYLVKLRSSSSFYSGTMQAEGSITPANPHNNLNSKGRFSSVKTGLVGILIYSVCDFWCIDSYVQTEVPVWSVVLEHILF